jgi:hypothetical protein
MNYRALISFIAIAGFLFSIIQSSSGCANIIPPEGGPRDTLPPVITKADPPINTKNFSERRITITFDEYVDLENAQATLIVNPLLPNLLVPSRKLNVVTIPIRDTLEPNTTYTLNFGNSIKDVNEGNIMKNFVYTFSTGPYIDSLQFGGKVLLAENNEVDSTLIVMLYNTPEDSAVYNKRPRYVTRLDNKGNFLFRNLSPGTFYAYAMKDDSRTYRYSPRQLFAFADSPVVVSSNTRSVTLYASVAEKEAPPSGSPPAPGGQGGRNRAVEKRLKFSTSVVSGRQELTENLSFRFEIPLRVFDSSKVQFVTDTLYTPITNGYRWTLDSTRKKLAFDYPWKEKTLYHFIIEKDFATDTLGQQLLKGDTISFTTKGLDDYGEVTIRFRNLDLASNPVLLFVLNNEVVRSFPLAGSTFTNSMFEPGDYNIRILSDANKNGAWDPGNFFKNRLQPERVQTVERKLTIRPKFKNVYEVAL